VALFWGPAKAVFKVTSAVVLEAASVDKAVFKVTSAADLVAASLEFVVNVVTTVPLVVASVVMAAMFIPSAAVMALAVSMSNYCSNNRFCIHGSALLPKPMLLNLSCCLHQRGFHRFNADICRLMRRRCHAEHFCLKDFLSTNRQWSYWLFPYLNLWSVFAGTSSSQWFLLPKPWLKFHRPWFLNQLRLPNYWSR
jgi:hypothetical protein